MSSTAGVEVVYERPSQRLHTLTGLRFVAAFVVFLSHAARMLDPAARTSVDWFTAGGYVGVSFFFMLSGFVLMWAAKPGDRARDFYRRRFARVYPAHLVTWLAVAALVLLASYPRPSAAGAGLGLVLLQAWVPDQSVFYALNGVAWSLSAEVFFYATFPLYARQLASVRPVLRRALLAAAVLGIIAVAAVASARVPHEQLTGDAASGNVLWALYNLPLVRVAEFVVGVVLALEVRDGLRLPRWALPVGLALSAGAFVVVSSYATTFGRVAITLAPFALVIVAAASRDLSGDVSLFARPMWVRLGEWSFSFYLVHQIVVHAVQYNHHFTSLPWWGMTSLALLVSSVALSAVLFHFVEKPAEKRLRGRRSTPLETSAAETSRA